MSNISHDENERGALRTLFTAIISGAVVAVTGIGAWGALLTAGNADPRVLPYIVPAMAAILVLGGAYLKWSLWPRPGRNFRAAAVRLNRARLSVILWALAAGWSSMLAGFCLYVAHRMTLGLGGEGLLQLPSRPFADLAPGLVMAGIVAGAVEEVAFRGFMQRPLERRFGVVPAILVSGLLWAAFHLNHSYFAEEPLLWPAIFLAVATGLGTIAYRTDSVIPGIAVHAGFDSAYFLAAGYLAPKTSPIAFIEAHTTPDQLIGAATVSAIAAAISWRGFFRATAAPRQ